MTIVTLTTDFGTCDGYVGAMKGVILSLSPDACIVDIAHDIERHDIAAGAYCLRQAAPYFPAGTVHVGVVDPGVGSARTPVIIDDGHHLYVGPDNGLFSLVAPAPKAAYAIENPGFVRNEVSSTFHGRDMFATAAAALAGGARPSDAGREVELRGKLLLGDPRDHDQRAPGTIVGTVIYVDHFGNLITDISADALPENPRVRVGRHHIDRLAKTFADVAIGEVLAYVGSAGTLEIGIREDHAARSLGVGRGTRVEVEAS
ncbi:SAM hydrolase/SAM-dependent halogenase family protein [Haliangium sp.]|uniref:SAM hydrolase/SAM-dependent halogenase family protein n=1 Tax=Haliangium sp. TaxID=2663208 RepID=UPI003D0F4F0B